MTKHWTNRWLTRRGQSARWAATTPVLAAAERNTKIAVAKGIDTRSPVALRFFHKFFPEEKLFYPYADCEDHAMVASTLREIGADEIHHNRC